MKRLLQTLLVIGALVGLFGQSMALARFTNAPVSQESARPSNDCMEAMAQAPQPSKPGQPCHGITLDCIAAMGCTVPALLGGSPELGVGPAPSEPLLWTASASMLSGRSLAPEPDPPSHS